MALTVSAQYISSLKREDRPTHIKTRTSSRKRRVGNQNKRILRIALLKKKNAGEKHSNKTKRKKRKENTPPSLALEM
jgi:hypothetical protein